MTSFLWYSGVTPSAEKLSFGGRGNKADLINIFSAYTGQDDTTPKLRNISGKIEAVRALIAFARKPCDGQSRYCKLLYDALNTIDLDKLSQALDGVDLWRGYRNEVIHAAKKLKKRPAIRRAVHMPAKKDG